MKGSIEACDLRQPREAQGNGLNALYRARHVKGCECNEAPQVLENRTVYSRWGGVVRSAMDNPMACSFWSRKAQTTGGLGYRGRCCSVRGELAADLDQRVAIEASDPQTTRRQRDSFNSAVGEPQFFGFPKLIESEFQGGGTAVQTKYNMLRQFSPPLVQYW
jgi:hypothetical protein